jgi:hypothetical protein
MEAEQKDSRAAREFHADNNHAKQTPPHLDYCSKLGVFKLLQTYLARFTPEDCIA